GDQKNHVAKCKAPCANDPARRTLGVRIVTGSTLAGARGVAPRLAPTSRRRRRRRHGRHLRGGREDLLGQQHPVERVHRDGRRRVHAAGELGGGPARHDADRAGGVCDVHLVRVHGHRARRRQLGEGRERVVPGHGVVQHERPELVGGEVGQHGLVEGRERRVLGREDGDALLGVVGLALERLDHVGHGEVLQELAIRPGEGEQFGELDVARGRRRRRGLDDRRPCLLGQGAAGERQAKQCADKNSRLGLHFCKT
uniref:Uncharacterized protein n=1 Tax=Triticum urartu TaxID=4572 RepID=A0A8R7R9B3_TRIUA